MLVTAITVIYCDDTKHIGVIIESLIWRGNWAPQQSQVGSRHHSTERPKSRMEERPPDMEGTFEKSE